MNSMRSHMEGLRRSFAALVPMCHVEMFARYDNAPASLPLLVFTMRFNDGAQWTWEVHSDRGVEDFAKHISQWAAARVA